MFRRSGVVLHGIDYDIGRLHLIQHTGVLSRSALRAKRLPSATNHNIYNGDHLVSVALPPTNRPSSIFARYIADKLTFVAEGVKVVEQGKQARGPEDIGGMLEGEGLVREIPPSAIKGIMVPRRALRARISDLPLELPMNRDGCVARLFAIFRTLQDVTGHDQRRMDSSRIDDLLNRSGSPLEVRRARAELGHHVQNIVEGAVARKLGKRTATLQDMLDVCVGGRLTRYDSHGFPIYDA